MVFVDFLAVLFHNKKLVTSRGYFWMSLLHVRMSFTNKESKGIC